MAVAERGVAVAERGVAVAKKKFCPVFMGVSRVSKSLILLILLKLLNTAPRPPVPGPGAII